MPAACATERESTTDAPAYAFDSGTESGSDKCRNSAPLIAAHSADHTMGAGAGADDAKSAEAHRRGIPTLAAALSHTAGTTDDGFISDDEGITQASGTFKVSLADNEECIDKWDHSAAFIASQSADHKTGGDTGTDNKHGTGEHNSRGLLARAIAPPKAFAVHRSPPDPASSSNKSASATDRSTGWVEKSKFGRAADEFGCKTPHCAGGIDKCTNKI